MKLFIRINYEHSSYEDFYEATDFPLVFGRDPRCLMRVMGKEIAREHGRIFVQEDQIFLSTEDKKLLVPLKEGSRVRIGRAILSFSFLAYPIDIDHLETVSSPSPSSFLDNWISIRTIGILYFLFILGTFLLAPNHFRTGDAFKELLKFTMLKGFIVPFLGTLMILFIRKFNRGEYGWKRSFFFTLIFSLVSIVFPFIEKLFCWFRSFHLVWNFGVSGFFLPVLILFLWFNAVGKDRTQKSRLIRSLLIVGILLSLSFSAYLLSTGYNSEFEIETCSSLTGWHWNSSESLKEWQSWLNEVKFE